MKVLVVSSDIQASRKLQAVLKTQKEIESLDSVVSAALALEIVRTETPGIVLIGAITSDLSGIEAGRILKEQNPEIDVVLTSTQFNKEFLCATIALKLDGYMPADVDQEVILKMIKRIQAGNPFYFAIDSPSPL